MITIGNSYWELGYSHRKQVRRWYEQVEIKITVRPDSSVQVHSQLDYLRVPSVA